MDRFRAVARESKELGSAGSPCIHPRQVSVLNEVFRPGEEELAQARAVVEAYEAGAERGVGALTVNGRFVDRPVYMAARQLLRRATIFDDGNRSK